MLEMESTIRRPNEEGGTQPIEIGRCDQPAERGSHNASPLKGQLRPSHPEEEGVTLPAETGSHDPAWWKGKLRHLNSWPQGKAWPSQP